MITPIPPDVRSIAWDRIIHFYGRACEVPSALERIEQGSDAECAAAFRLLRRNLEHQDGVIHATAVAVPFVVSAIHKTPQSARRVAILDLLETFLSSADVQLAGYQPSSPPPSWDDLVSMDALWPPFESEEIDAELWEEPTVVDNVELWAFVTRREIVAGRPLYAELATGDDKPVAAAASQLLSLIDEALSGPTASVDAPEGKPAGKAWWHFW